MNYLAYDRRSNKLCIVHVYGTDKANYVNLEDEQGHVYDLPVQVYVLRFCYIGELD
jgi:hypothetical protein